MLEHWFKVSRLRSCQYLRFCLPLDNCTRASGSQSEISDRAVCQVPKTLGVDAVFYDASNYVHASKLPMKTEVGERIMEPFAKVFSRPTTNIPLFPPFFSFFTRGYGRGDYRK